MKYCKVTSSDLIEFESLLRDKGVAESTISAYLGEVLRCFSGADNEAFEGAVEKYLSKSLSYHTLKRRYQALKSFSEVMGLQLDIEVNLDGKSRRAKPVNSVPKNIELKIEEKSSGLHEKVWKRDKLACLLSLCCGMTSGEIVSLDLSDLKIEGDEVFIEKGDKRIPLINIVRRALLDFLLLRDGEEAVGGAPLFLSRKKNRLSQRTLQSGIKRFLSRSGNAGHSCNGRTLKKVFHRALRECSGRARDNSYSTESLEKVTKKLLEG